MAIATLDQYIASVKQRIEWVKTATRTTVATFPFSMFDIAGQPGAGTLAGTSTANGVVPTDATTGCPIINFSSGVGYAARVEFNNTVASRLALFDMLFKAGAYAFNANTTLSSQPAFSSRCPDYSGGASFGCGNEIWIECVTAFTGNMSVAVTYTNQAGTTGRTTGTVATGIAPTVGRMIQLQLQAGDCGVQKIESVVSTVASAGTFNVLVLRPLWTSGRVRAANDASIHDILSTGMPIVYTDSALFVQVAADSTSTGQPELNVEIASA